MRTNTNASSLVLLVLFRVFCESESFTVNKPFATSRRRTIARASNTNDDDNDEGSSPLSSFSSNVNNIDDEVLSAMSGCGGVKVTCATVRNLVNDAVFQHGLNAVPADALSRSLTCGLLMSNGMPDEQTVQITTACDGPLGKVISIVTGDGKVKGYVDNPTLKGFKDMELRQAIGKGSTQVVKNHPDWPRPYNGVTAIRSGEIDRDVGVYLAESEQRVCAVAAAACVEGVLCHSAGGYLIEQLPGCDEETILKVRENLKVLVEKDGGKDLPSNLLRKGYTPAKMAEILLDGLNPKPLGIISPVLECGCGEDRLLRALFLLPEEEVNSLIEEQEVIEAKCEFCNKIFRMGPEEVQQALATARAMTAGENNGTGEFQ